MLGKTLTLDNSPYMIVGVLPTGIRFGSFSATRFGYRLRLTGAIEPEETFWL